MSSNQEKNPFRNLVRAYIGLGSNAGDRVGYVQQAMQLLKDIPRVEVIECSSFYETEPIKPTSINSAKPAKRKANMPEEETPWFVNAVASLETDLSAQELYEVCKDIEARLHDLARSMQDGKNGHQGRIIDLDILLFGNTILHSEKLTLPHPNLERRAYALVPLLEVAPDVVHPEFHKTVSELHEELEEPEMVYLYGTRGEDFELE